jgi:hypothetical protein
MIASGEEGTSPFVSTDYRDSVSLAGPFAMLSMSGRLLKRTPITARISGGLTRLTTETANDGDYQGKSDGQSISGRLQIDEPRRAMILPFVGTELRFGYQLGQVSADLGVALALFLPRSPARSGRAGLLEGQPRTTGVFTLAPEKIVGPFLAVSPTVAARWQF